MPFAEVGDIRLYYELRGKGPRLLHVSGTFSDLRREPGPLEQALPERFETLFFDQRGLGRSDKPASAYTMADYADDAAGLLAALGWSDARVLGHSFGGMVAQQLALRHPKRLTRLVLTSTTAGGAGGSSIPLHEWIGVSAEERGRRWVLASDLRRDGAWQAANPAALQDLITAHLASLRVPGGDPAARIGALRQIEARSGHDTWDSLAALDLPVFVFAGRHDGVAPLAAQRAMAGRIPGATFASFAGGHAFFAESAEAREAILAALGGP